jgi:hypothetical protein
VVWDCKRPQVWAYWLGRGVKGEGEDEGGGQNKVKGKGEEMWWP